MLVALFAALPAAASAQPQSAQPASKPKAARAATPAAVEPRLDPKALELLKAMSARLAGARTMSFTAVSTYESPSQIGLPLAYATESEVTLQRPDKLKVITPGDGPATEVYYDGKTIMAYAPAENLVAVADAPPTIDAVLKAAYDKAAIYFPFTDVIVADPYKDITEGLQVAFVIGQSHVVGGTTTDIVAIADKQVFSQIWIGTDDKLPRMMRAVYASDPAQRRHQTEFSKWSLDADLPADTFASPAAAGAQRIQFARPDPQPPRGATPAAGKKGKPPKMK